MSSITAVKQRRVTTSTSSGKKDNDKGKLNTADKDKLLYDYNELPEWQKDNDKIITGYVRENNSFVNCLKSLTYLNNESVNIYTHLCSAMVYFVLLLFFTDLMLIPSFPSTTMTDYIIINFYLLGAFMCLMCSSCFHCFKQHSEAHSDIWSKVDYMGIIGLISCSVISLLYYGFFDHVFYFKLFAVITVVLATCCSVCVLSEKFNTKNMRPLRATFFIGFAFSSIIPILTGTLKFGLSEVVHRVQLRFVGWEALFYLSGAVIYGYRIPETIAPGKFDFFGSSHQIFHVLVVIGSLCHLRAVMGSYMFMHSHLNAPNLITFKV
ncbi:hypothetical protein HG535_0H03360 [Zygotorulaspora mrakii]|uniref:Uncharacterized protein n=1 Tax=Zygotorulaspora mrakii TaxID=42260 RepID=A0A7H9BAF7_ZYGMR|nr:uncharacterized protein HG535_0H03360 [Zygotorulaspora mrakii]QLG75009.1 hypothetical protein HG535_0H03360 [Zygotorulaspora mrakii]